MARKLDSFPGDERPQAPQRRYPWSDWTDGDVWEIRKGADYDVDTENMRVNLHMRADTLFAKVRTRKVDDDRGEGLVFQFLESDEMEAVKMASAEDPRAAEAAMEQLYIDALEIYERAREEVTIQRKDGTRQRYAANRYKPQIERGYRDNALVPTIARIVRRRTLGFGHLENAGRPDLMVETLVLDETKPYHRFFSAKTVQQARDRMREYEERHRGQNGAAEAAS
jgi:hypothetical protein